MKLLTFAGMKWHYVPDQSVEALKEQMLTKYNLHPTKEEDVESAWLDAGGMLDLTTQPLKFEVESETFEVKPEHVYSVAYRWTRNRQYGDYQKIYLRDHCVFLSQETYETVRSWLESNIQAGIDARVNIAERLADCDHVYVHVPTIAKEKGEA
jgi:hypothetical protein